MMELISVIIPVYNAEKTINRCIDSILAQSYQNLQVILVNDGSTDSSLQICEEYKSIDSRILLLDGPNQGVSKARNLGMEHAQGTYWGFVDSDDWIEPTYFELLHLGIQAFPNCALAVIGVASESWVSYLHKLCEGKEICSLTYSQAIDEITAKFGLRGYLCNKLFFATTQRLNISVSVCEDLEFVIRYLSQYRSSFISVVNACGYHYELSKPDTYIRNRYGFIRAASAFDAYDSILEHIPSEMKQIHERILGHITEVAYTLLVAWYSLTKGEQSPQAYKDYGIASIQQRLRITFWYGMKQAGFKMRIEYLLMRMFPALLIVYVRIKFQLKKRLIRV
ncbi:MAG: glycosyltransferase family 2 protein [Sphaerochaeta associata]|uniref:glycosyltransferase family 2 protein n=1 Tax=Sphaerochaeta associata TaxID=1129264 RepID=UPI002B1FA6E3|nr:glycosyltransferase family 2 protein [Sphaerochaeta associata]MEA5108196.1 glycosyltransferase family 2 protein [Sphaerochaeta associata]